jgi:transcriptional regulator with XRE-family HTH domain
LAVRFLTRILRFLDHTPFAPGRSLPERLRVRRRTLGLSERELARTLDVDESTLARLERGTRRPSEVLLDRLRTVLDSRLRSALRSTDSS